MSEANKKHKHLTLSDRIAIEYCLSDRWPLADIAGRLGNDPTTISKEIKKKVD
jgi:IS30 family transposase